MMARQRRVLDLIMYCQAGSYRLNYMCKLSTNKLVMGYGLLRVMGCLKCHITSLQIVHYFPDCPCGATMNILNLSF